MVTTLAGPLNSHALTEFDGFEIFNVDATRGTKIFDKKLSFKIKSLRPINGQWVVNNYHVSHVIYIMSYRSVYKSQYSI